MARHLKKLLCIVLVVFMLVGCAPTSPSTIPYNSIEKVEERLAQYAQLGTSPDDNYRTWYEIFVYSFCD